jgi:hypothetical protein
MMRSLLVRGMIAGLLGGLVAFGIAKIVGEPEVDTAIAFEEFVAGRDEAAADAGHSHVEEDEELVSRSQQNFAGLGTGALIYGVAMGGLFALVFGLAYGRLGTFTARGTAALLGLLGFVSVFLVPFLKYPAVPPAIGDPDTIGERTSLYLGLILISIAAMVIAVVARRRLTVRLGEWNATLGAAGGYVAAMIICSLLLPGINDVPQAALRGVIGAEGDAGVTFPGIVLWRFRVSAVAVQVALWATVAISFGFLARKPLEAGTVPEHEDATAGH